MRKLSLLKKLFICGAAIVLSTNSVQAGVITDAYSHYKQITYEVSILPIDEIDEVVTEFKSKEISWVVCNSELEHIEVMKNVKTNKWKVIVYAEQVVIEKYEK